VVVCSKAGAEFDLQLIWTLWLASIVAFQLQNQAARGDVLLFTSYGVIEMVVEQDCPGDTR
jgi:Mn2+/Fe2+ NRAMP family transporter